MRRGSIDLRDLAAEAAAVARRVRFEVDRSAYTCAGRDPREPILVAGDLGAPVCVVGRDLGRDEVLHAQPLVGRSGRAVRTAVLEAAGETPSEDDPLLERALRHVLLTNLVPYKPPGNRAFPKRVREAFRPVVERLLVCGFRGHRILALGNDAFAWFAPYMEAGVLERTARRDRFEAALTCRIQARDGHGRLVRAFTLCALPHPSPANARYKARFGELLARRLATVTRHQ
jgi:uracil-DNA glycosylase